MALLLLCVFSIKLIRVTQPELVHTQKSQESQATEESKSGNSKTSTTLELGRVQLAPESSQAGMGFILGMYPEMLWNTVNKELYSKYIKSRNRIT